MYCPHDFFYNFVHRQAVGIDDGVGLGVALLAPAQKLFDPLLSVSAFQKRPALRASRSPQQSFRRSGKADQQTPLFEQAEILLVDYSPATRGNDLAIFAEKLFQGAVLGCAEIGFSLPPENIVHLHPLRSFDGPIQIDKAPVELPGQSSAHEGLPHRHEAGQGDVLRVRNF
jgi:hypothetical protein